MLGARLHGAGGSRLGACERAGPELKIPVCGRQFGAGGTPGAQQLLLKRRWRTAAGSSPGLAQGESHRGWV